MQLDWPTLACVCTVLTVLAGAVRYIVRSTSASAVLLAKISTAVLGDAENDSLGKQITEMRTEFSDLVVNVRSIHEDQGAQHDRLSRLEGKEEANARAARHAIRNLQHQVGFVFGELKLAQPPPPPLDPFDIT